MGYWIVYSIICNVEKIGRKYISFYNGRNYGYQPLPHPQHGIYILVSFSVIITQPTCFCFGVFVDDGVLQVDCVFFIVRICRWGVSDYLGVWMKGFLHIRSLIRGSGDGVYFSANYYPSFLLKHDMILKETHFHVTLKGVYNSNGLGNPFLYDSIQSL